MAELLARRDIDDILRAVDYLNLTAQWVQSRAGDEQLEQVTDALLLAFAGSVVGSVAGALLSRLTNAYGETFIQQPLGWRLYPEALFFGMVLGVVVVLVATGGGAPYGSPSLTNAPTGS